MLKKRWDKSRLPSRHVTEGPDRAPHRSYYYAMGLTEDEINQPFVGVASCWNEAAPCNISLNRQAQSVKRGVVEAGGTPREFTTISVTDGIAMGHQGMKSSLVSREVIADSVELTMRGHCYDALVGLAAQRDVAGRGLVPAGGDADEGQMNLLLAQAHGVEVAAVRRPLRAFGDVAAGELALVELRGVHRLPRGLVYG